MILCDNEQCRWRSNGHNSDWEIGRCRKDAEGKTVFISDHDNEERLPVCTSEEQMERHSGVHDDF